MNGSMDDDSNDATNVKGEKLEKFHQGYLVLYFKIEVMIIS